ncbi:MAG: cell division protein ZapA [Gammaproteobacteria bacterium]
MTQTTDKSLKIINIQVLDRSFPVKCPENEVEQLMKAAHHLNTQMRKVRDSSRTAAFDRIAVMVALNLCHELLFTHQRNDGEVGSLDQRLRQLQQKVEQAMCNSFIEQLDKNLTSQPHYEDVLSDV